MDLFAPEKNDHVLACQEETVEVLLPQLFDHGFDYRVPARMAGRVTRGDLVKVNFGPRKAEAKYVLGVVWGPGKGEVPPEKCKPIAHVFRDLPPLPEPLLETIQWIASYTMAPVGAVLKMVLPQTMFAFDPPKENVIELAAEMDIEGLTPKRRKVVEAFEYMHGTGGADSSPHALVRDAVRPIARNNSAARGHTKQALAKAAGVSTSILRSMEKAGLLIAREEVAHIDHSLNARKGRGEDSSPNPSVAEGVRPIARNSSAARGHTKKLSSSQSEATTLLAHKLDHGFSVTLLDGVTGSGKTEVYFDTIEKALSQSDGQVLVMLPEIALSHQWLKRCEARFGFAPAVWHSGITQRQRAITLRSIMTGAARLIVGARSALLLPYKNLKLIIIDEEHDGSYKQEEGVMYHARDMAVLRAQKEQIPLVLASATPSLETMANVQRERYSRVVLESRYGKAQMPSVSLIDMRSEPMDRGRWLSPALRGQILETLSRGHQSLLFLNRRGYAPLVLCNSCGHRYECPNCSAWMVLHASGRPYLQCHHCDTRLPVPKQCPECGEADTLVPCGPGVERIAEEVQQTIPQARLGILSSDLVSDTKQEGLSLQELLTKMEAREIDILIGTQLIAKGHHFPYLSLVGVIDADLGLSGGDIRASERSFQLLHQLSGRAGREHTGGEVYLQSYMPDHPVMQALKEGNRDGLLALEMRRRQAMEMPPFGRLAAIILEGKNETEVRDYAAQLAKAIPQMEEIRILGPAPAPLLKLRRYFRYRFLIQAPLNCHIQKLIEEWLAPHPTPRGMKRKIDIDPYSFV